MDKLAQAHDTIMMMGMQTNRNKNLGISFPGQFFGAIRQLAVVCAATSRADTQHTQTSLHAAAYLGRSDLVQQLLHAGSAVWPLLDAGAAVDAADREGVTPLAWGAAVGDAKVVKQLLDAGGTVDAADRAAAGCRSNCRCG